MWSGLRRGDRCRAAGAENFCAAGITGRRRIQRTPARQQAFGEFRGRRRERRGTSPPANPYFFVRKHHAPEANSAAGGVGVVPHPPQSLVPSSGRTTPSAQLTPPARPAWCLIPRKPFFLHPDAPRPQPNWRRRRGRRGASSPANPYSFVRTHHALSSTGAAGGVGVVPHPPPNPCSFVRKHHAPEPNSAAGATGVVPHTPQMICSPYRRQ